MQQPSRPLDQFSNRVMRIHGFSRQLRYMANDTEAEIIGSLHRATAHFTRAYRAADGDAARTYAEEVQGALLLCQGFNILNQQELDAILAQLDDLLDSLH